ncbi:unnamed protein product [Urochloa humidicola]
MALLQLRVKFFDENKDGIITVTESIKAFIAIGCDPIFATSAATATHAAFGPLTTPPGKLPSTNIHVSHIHGAVHASDTGSYDKKGNFIPKKFEKIFQRFSRSEEDALSWLEVETMLTVNRDLLKPWTWPAAETEWQLIHFLGRQGQARVPSQGHPEGHLRRHRLPQAAGPHHQPSLWSQRGTA